MHVVIISEHDDAHIPFVREHLSKHARVTIIDPYGGIKEKQSISFGFNGSGLSTLVDGKPHDDVTAVWYRKPTILENVNLRVDEHYRTSVESALKSHHSVLQYHWKDALWVSKFEAKKAAEHKPHQMEVANSLGLRVPKTLITNDAVLAQTFLHEQKLCVFKTQMTAFPPGKFMMTKLVSSNENIDWSGLYLNPMIFQQYIEPAYELRVTVVGKKLFAAKVGGKDIDGKTGPFRDWRYAHLNDTFYAEETLLDQPIAEACIKLVEKLKLNFGAIDFIVDKKGQVWFLEINPNGQWAFIEEETGQQIGKALAELLEQKV
ncbi:MAG: hypothetical protein ACREGJ_04700 [Candidatus Saccharimonadales bacterium]